QANEGRLRLLQTRELVGASHRADHRSNPRRGCDCRHASRGDSSLPCASFSWCRRVRHSGRVTRPIRVDARDCAERRRSPGDGELGQMLLPEVDYARPESVEEALRLLGSRDNTRALAGGQSLVNVMKVRVASPDFLVDLGRIRELREIRAGDGGLEIGAMATY